jgi:sugar phosphate isomerase/epimerase
MRITRRELMASGSFAALGTLAAAAAPAAEAPAEVGGRRPGDRSARRRVAIRVGAMDGVIGGGTKALETAKKTGIQGVQADAGGAEDTLRICRPEIIDEYLKLVETTGVAMCSICMGLLNGSPFITEKRAVGWVSGVIDAAAKLNAKTILMAFFGAGELKDRAAIDICAGLVKGLAPKAAEKGVTLGMENWLSAQDNLYLLEKAGNPPGLKIYYDIGNSTLRGYDVPAEIRLLGEKICEIHFKDYKSGLLGQGEIDMAAVAQAIVEIGYKGWIVLETGAPLGAELTAAANAGYIRGLFARWNAPA